MEELKSVNGKKYLIIDSYTLDKVLDIIKRIGIKNSMNGDDKLPIDITLKNGVILMTCVIKDGEKYFLQLFLKEALYHE